MNYSIRAQKARKNKINKIKKIESIIAYFTLSLITSSLLYYMGAILIKTL